MTSLQPQYFGTVYRTFRLAEFVAVLWLLTPWWGRRDLLLVRCHLRVLVVILARCSLACWWRPAMPCGGAGSRRALGRSLPRRSRTMRRYFGLVVVLWLCGQVRGRATLFIVVVAVAILVLTHTGPPWSAW